MTAADREILQSGTRRRAPSRASPSPPRTTDQKPAGRGKWAGARDDGDAKPRRTSGPRKPGDDKPPSAKASYLLTLARVKDLYRSRQYELALVELAELEGNTRTTSTSCP